MVNIYVTFGETLQQLTVQKSQKIRSVRNEFCRLINLKTDGDLYLRGTKLLGDKTVLESNIQEDDILEYAVQNIIDVTRIVPVSVTTMRAKGKETLYVALIPFMTVGELKATIVRDHIPRECVSPSQLMISYRDTELYDNQTLQSLNLREDSILKAKIIPLTEDPNLSYDIIATTINGQSLATLETCPTQDLLINFTIADENPVVAMDQLILSVYSVDERGNEDKHVQLDRISTTVETNKQFTVSYIIHDDLTYDTVYWMRLQSFHDRYQQHQDRSIVSISFRTQPAPTSVTNAIYPQLKFSWPNCQVTWVVSLELKLDNLGDLFRLSRAYLQSNEPHLLPRFDHQVSGFMIERQDAVLTAGELQSIELEWDDQVRAVLPQYDTIVLLEQESNMKAENTTVGNAINDSVINKEDIVLDVLKRSTFDHHLPSQPVEPSSAVSEEQMDVNSHEDQQQNQVFNETIFFSNSSDDQLQPNEEQVERNNDVEFFDTLQLLENIEQAGQEYHQERYFHHQSTPSELLPIEEEEDEQEEWPVVQEEELPPVSITNPFTESDLRRMTKSQAIDESVLNELNIPSDGDLAEDTNDDGNEGEDTEATEAEQMVETVQASNNDGNCEKKAEVNDEISRQVTCTTEGEILEGDDEFVFVDVHPTDMQSILYTDDAAHADIVE